MDILFASVWLVANSRRPSCHMTGCNRVVSSSSTLTVSPLSRVYASMELCDVHGFTLQAVRSRRAVERAAVTYNEHISEN